ncbi:MAG: outer membrane beta-barrel protein [Spirochaetota bacterium]|nr:outer membrane beta-barrel protein [Spirochaetota bacterium]
MKQMRNAIAAILTISFMLFVPISGSAFIDIGLYMGRSVNGNMELGELKTELGKDSTDVDGWEYGISAHLNTGVPLLFTAGIGLFYQITSLTYDYRYDGINSKELDTTKNTYGFDGYFQIDLPFLPIYPYVRAGTAIKDETKIDTVEYIGTTQETINEKIKEKYFQSYYYGFGLSYTLYDAVVMDLQLFAEYLITKSKQESDIEIEGQSVRAGVKLAL